MRGLPEDAAVWRQDRRGWTQADELAASQIEITDLWGRILAVVLGAKPGKLPKPPTIDHPGRRAPEAPKPTRKPTTDPREIQAFLGRLGK